MANTLAAAPRRELIHPGVLKYLREAGIPARADEGRAEPGERLVDRAAKRLRPVGFRLSRGICGNRSASPPRALPAPCRRRCGKGAKAAQHQRHFLLGAGGPPSSLTPTSRIVSPGTSPALARGSLSCSEVLEASPSVTRMSARACSIVPRGCHAANGSAVTASTAAPATPPTSPPTTATGTTTIMQRGPPMVQRMPADDMLTWRRVRRRRSRRSPRHRSSHGCPGTARRARAARRRPRPVPPWRRQGPAGGAR